MNAVIQDKPEQLSFLHGRPQPRRRARLIADVPISRRSDPITSHEAAIEITRNGMRAKQQQAVLNEVIKYPGRTSIELATRATFDRWTAGRRLPELERAGKVTRGAPRICGITGFRSITWWPVKN